jgi:hypothetical protein
VIVLVGCGSAQPTQLAEFVARTEKLCPEALAGLGGRAEAVNPSARKQVQVLIRQNMNLPVTREFLTYVREGRQLRLSEQLLRSRLPPSVSASDPKRRALFRRRVEIYRAERRLPGIGACALSPYSNL